MSSDKNHAQLGVLRQAHAIRERFETAWRTGQQPVLERFLDEIDEPGRETLLTELLGVELELRHAGGSPPKLDEYRARFPQHITLVDQIFAEVLAMASLPARAAVVDIDDVGCRG